MKSNFRTLFLVVLPLLLPAAITAQTSRASVRGTVHDAKLAVIPEAKVSVTNTATGEHRTVTADSEGNYAISSLPAGRYELNAEYPNFQKLSQQIELHVNQEERVDIQLEVSGPDLAPLNTTDDAQMKRDTSSLGTVIENRQITNLPLDGRNFYELSLLVPGAVPP